MAELVSELEYWSVIVKMGFGDVKRYVKHVGLDMPRHYTKGSLVKLIKANGKYKEDELKDETMLPGSSPSTAEVMKAKTVQPVIAQKIKASTLQRRASAAKNDTEFRKTKKKSDLKAEQECKRFRQGITPMGPAILGGFRQDHVRSLQNKVKFCDLSPDDLEQAIQDLNICVFDSGFLAQLVTHYRNIPVLDWNNACAAEYDFPDDCNDQFLRWAKYIRIPNVREKVIGMSMFLEAQNALRPAHEFSDIVHSALYEIVQTNEMVRYLTAILMFSRQKKVPTLQLWKMKNLEPGAIGLLKCLMRAQNRYVTAQDVFDMKNWDKFKKIREGTGKTMGGVMKEFFEKGDVVEEEEVKASEADVEEEEERHAEVPLSALMTELTNRTELTPANVTAATMRKLQQPKVPKTEEEIHRENIARIQFSLPMPQIHRVNLPVQQAISFALSHDLQQTKLCEELQDSYDKLVLTSKNITAMWTDCERSYFSSHRTQFLKKIADPEFHVICTIVEDDWGFEMPDVIWGLIWEFRVPFTRSLDMRYAYEVFEDFEKNHPGYLDKA